MAANTGDNRQKPLIFNKPGALHTRPTQDPFMPKCPLIADRAFVPFSTTEDGRGTNIKLLYDTGAQASILTQQDVALLRRCNVPCTKIDDEGFRLTAANNTPIRSTGVVRVSLYTPSGKAVRAPFFVCPDASTSILGMNVIGPFKLTLDPITLEADMSEPTVSGISEERPVFVQTRKTITLEGRQGVNKCYMALTDEDGNSVRGKRDVIVDFAAATSAVVTTNDKGHFAAPLSNLKHKGYTVKEGTRLARAYNIEDYHYISEVTIKQQIEKPKPFARRHTNTEKQKIQEAIKANINKNVTLPEQHMMLQGLMEYEDVFSADKNDIGYCPLLEHTIDLTHDTPIFRPQFRIPKEDLAAIKDQTAAWLKMGIVRRGKSPYNNPIFGVPKPRGGLRIVLDFRGLNDATKTDRYCIPSVEETLTKIGDSGAKYFSSLDLSSGFYHIPLRESDQKYTAFTIPGDTQYIWLRSPMGTKGSPSTFCRALDLILSDVASCINYVDDILCFTATVPEHITAIRPILERLRGAGLRVNPGKSTFLQTELDYLGASISADGVRPTLDKTEAIRNIKPPATRKQLNSCLGFFNYMSKYVWHYTAKVRPLHGLVKTKWQNGPLPEKALEAFHRIKNILLARPAVGYLLKGLDLHLFVDAATGDQRHNGKGFGAVLLQDRPNDIRRPIVYLSRALTAAEENYPAGLAELKAITWAVHKLNPYIKHKEFYLYSDHKPLTDKMLSATHKKTFAHCDTLMENFYPKWRRVDGTGNVIADFLSRYNGMAADNHKAPIAPQNVKHILEQQAHNAAIVSHWQVDLLASDDSLARLRWNQSQDGLCHAIMEEIRTRVTNSTVENPQPTSTTHLSQQVTMFDGVLMVKPPTNQLLASKKTPFRIYAPLSMRQELVNSAHGSHVQFAGHFGIDKSYERLATDFWYPGMRTAVKKFIAECGPCKMATDKGASPPGRQVPIPTPLAPNDLVHMDLEGPVKTRRGKQYILIIIDALTKHATLRLIPNKKAPAIAREMYRYSCMYGVPKRMVSDNGLEFNNALEAETCRLLGIARSTTSHYHPKANGLAEQFNQVIQGYMRTALHVAKRDNRNFEDFILPLQFAYNTSWHHTNRCSPHEAMYGYPHRAPLWEDYSGLFQPRGRRHDPEHARIQRRVQTLVDLRQEARQNAEHEKEQQARRHDENTGARYTDFQAKEPVLVRNFTKGPVNPKFSTRWREAFIIKSAGPNAYVVYVPGAGRDQRGFTQKLNVIDIKKAPIHSTWLNPKVHSRARAGLFDTDPNDITEQDGTTTADDLQSESETSHRVTWGSHRGHGAGRGSWTSEGSYQQDQMSERSESPIPGTSRQSQRYQQRASPIPGTSRQNDRGSRTPTSPLRDTATPIPHQSLLFQRSPDHQSEFPLPQSMASSCDTGISTDSDSDTRARGGRHSKRRRRPIETTHHRAEPEESSSDSDSSASADSNRPNKRNKRRRQPVEQPSKHQRAQGLKRAASGSRSLEDQPRRTRRRHEQGTKRKLGRTRNFTVRNPGAFPSDDDSMPSDEARERLDLPDWGDPRMPSKKGRRPADEVERRAFHRGRPAARGPFDAAVYEVEGITEEEEILRRMNKLLQEDEPERAIARAIATNYLPLEQGEVRYGTPPKPAWTTPPMESQQRRTLTPLQQSRPTTRVTWADRTPTRLQQSADNTPTQHQQQTRRGGRGQHELQTAVSSPNHQPLRGNPEQQRRTTQSNPTTTGVELAEQQWGGRMATFRHNREAFKQRIYQAGKQAVREHQLEHERNNRARDIAQEQARDQARRSAPATTSRPRWWQRGPWSRLRR